MYHVSGAAPIVSPFFVGYVRMNVQTDAISAIDRISLISRANSRVKGIGAVSGLSAESEAIIGCNRSAIVSED